MKVLLVNGSPKKNGTTHAALVEVARTLKEEGIETEEFHIGAKPISGCIDCRACAQTGRCVISDCVNDCLALAQNSDGFIFGTPVHFAGPSGGLVCFMDRLFFPSIYNNKAPFYLKPAASVIVARRAGCTATYDQLNKYFGLIEMPIIPAAYWNMAYGMTPEDVAKDAEGMQIMRTVARNMAWFLKCTEAGAKAGLPLPKREEQILTNFIR